MSVLFAIAGQVSIVWMTLAASSYVIQYFFMADVNGRIPSPIAFASAMTSTGVILFLAIGLSIALWSQVK